MKLYIVSILIAATVADKLNNGYLPPETALYAGGNEKLLKVPLYTFENLQGEHLYGSSLSSVKTPEQLPSLESYGKPISPSSESYGIHKPPVKIVRYENSNNGQGNYAYGYETENKITAQVTSQSKNVGTENEVNVVRGSYSYTGSDGIIYTVNYVADENGFQASGAHLPTSPPIPDAIIKAIEYNAAHPDSVKYGLTDDNKPNFLNTKVIPAQSIKYSESNNEQLPVNPSFDSKTGYKY